MGKSAYLTDREKNFLSNVLVNSPLHRNGENNKWNNNKKKTGTLTHLKTVKDFSKRKSHV